jgi:aryl-alcohol dehydrogenase-like predicted oxidoreductase
VGIRTEQQLNDAVGAANSPLLSEAEVQQLQSVVKPAIYEQHR